MLFLTVKGCEREWECKNDLIFWCSPNEIVYALIFMVDWWWWRIENASLCCSFTIIKILCRIKIDLRCTQVAPSCKL